MIFNVKYEFNSESVPTITGNIEAENMVQALNQVAIDGIASWGGPAVVKTITITAQIEDY